MAQMSESQPPQIMHVQSEPTTSTRLRKLPTQLNTPKRYISNLVRASPNASDVQRLGRFVPAFRHHLNSNLHNVQLPTLELPLLSWINLSNPLATHLLNTKTFTVSNHSIVFYLVISPPHVFLNQQSRVTSKEEHTGEPDLFPL